MTEVELNKLAKKIAKSFWGLTLDVNVKIDKKFNASFGKFIYKKISNTPVEIKISRFLIKNFTRKTVIAILAHEVCHWAMCKLNKPFRDKDKYFQKELKKFGIPEGNDVKVAGTFVNFVCSNCEKKYSDIYLFMSLEKILNKRSCKNCNSKLEAKSFRHVKDKNNFIIQESDFA